MREKVTKRPNLSQENPKANPSKENTRRSPRWLFLVNSNILTTIFAPKKYMVSVFFCSDAARAAVFAGWLPNVGAGGGARIRQIDIVWVAHCHKSESGRPGLASEVRASN